jgi:signal transduction histidine kinase
MSGNLMLILFSSFSLIMLVLNWKPFGVSSLFNRSLFYYEAGVAAELVFFLLGLSFKNRKELVQRTAEKEQLKLENRRKEFEKQIAILQAQQEERNRISRDIHDELGGGMTAIRLMSELAKERMKTQKIPEIEKISASANDLLTKMNAIVWSMSHSNDSVSNLVAYIRNYAMEFFENTPIECQVEAPQEIPSLEMSGEKRRNIFLSLKETLNNTLKHSGSSEYQDQCKHKFEICVHDNGRGFNVEKTRQFGTGLQNIKRMDSIYGNFSVEGKEGHTHCWQSKSINISHSSRPTTSAPIRNQEQSTEGRNGIQCIYRI